MFIWIRLRLVKPLEMCSTSIWKDKFLRGLLTLHLSVTVSALSSQKTKLLHTLPEFTSHCHLHSLDFTLKWLKKLNRSPLTWTSSDDYLKNYWNPWNSLRGGKLVASRVTKQEDNGHKHTHKPPYLSHPLLHWHLDLLLHLRKKKHVSHLTAVGTLDLV